MSCAPERRPFPLLQGAGGGEGHSRVLGVQVPPRIQGKKLLGASNFTSRLRRARRSSEPSRMAWQGGTTCLHLPPKWKCEAETETASCVDREKLPGSGVCLGGSFPLPRWVLSLPEAFCWKACSFQAFFWGGGLGWEKGEVTKPALCHEVSERWSKRGEGDLVLHGDHRSKL